MKFKDLFLAIMILCGLAWFIQFQLNPETICQDHPDPKKRKDYYQCEPFGFDLKKGTFLDRRGGNQIALWHQITGDNEKSLLYGRKDKVINKENKIINKIDKKWDCDPKFYLIPPQELTNEIIDKYCHKVKNGNINTNNNSLLPNINDANVDL